MKELRGFYAGLMFTLCILPLSGCGNSTSNSSESATSDLAVKPDKVKKIEVGKKLIAVLYENGAIEKTSVDFQRSPIPSGTYEDVAISSNHVCLIAKKSKKLTCRKIETTLGIFKETKPPIDNVKYTRVWAGDDHFCAIREDNGHLVCWGTLCGSDLSSSCWEANLFNTKLADEKLATIPEDKPLPKPKAVTGESKRLAGNSHFKTAAEITDSPLSFASNGKTSCYIDHIGVVKCFGGDIDPIIVKQHEQFQTRRSVQVTVSEFFACILQQDGEVACWGMPASNFSSSALHGTKLTGIWSGQRIICGRTLQSKQLVCDLPDAFTRASEEEKSLNFIQSQEKLQGIGLFGMSHSPSHKNFCLADAALQETNCFIANQPVQWKSIKGKDIRKGVARYVNSQ